MIGRVLVHIVEVLRELLETVLEFKNRNKKRSTQLKIHRGL